MKAEPPVAAQWVTRRIRAPQAISRDNARRVLERLGARDVQYSGMQVDFLTLAPTKGGPEGASSPVVQARWEKVSFRANSSTKIYRDGVDKHVYLELEDGILTAFTTRNFIEQSGMRLSVEVLHPIAEPVPLVNDGIRP